MGKHFTARWILVVLAVVVAIAIVAFASSDGGSASLDDRAERVDRSAEVREPRISAYERREAAYKRRFDHPGPPDGSNGTFDAGYQSVSYGGLTRVWLLDHPLAVAYDDGEHGFFYQELRTGTDGTPTRATEALALTPPADRTEGTIYWLEAGMRMATPVVLPTGSDAGEVITWSGLVGAGIVKTGHTETRYEYRHGHKLAHRYHAVDPHLLLAYAEGHHDSGAPIGHQDRADLVIVEPDVGDAADRTAQPKVRLRIRDAWTPTRRAGPVSIWIDTVAYPAIEGGRTTWHLFDQRLHPVRRPCSPIRCRTGRALRHLQAPMDGPEDLLTTTWTGPGSAPLLHGADAPTWEEIAESEAPAICDHPAARLVRGVDESVPGGTGYFNLPTRLYNGRSAVARGLPSSDGGPLTVAVGYCNAGGVPWENPILAFGPDGRPYASTFLFDGPWKRYGLDGPGRWGVLSIRIDGDQVQFHVRAYRPGDAGCCQYGQAIVWAAARDHKLVVTRIERLPDFKH
jgi:hypothetical protein